MIAVRFAMVNARDVLNLASPRAAREVVRVWKGKRPWHDAHYEPLRDIIEAHYINRFNAASGHYKTLEASVIREGFRNPVLLTTGRLMRRQYNEVPPTFDLARGAVCEWVGGSRLYVAARLNIQIPAIINDYAAIFQKGRLVNRENVLSFFTDKPRVVEWWKDGALYANYLPYTHFTDLRYRRLVRAAQTPLRLAIINETLKLTHEWLEANDRA